MLHQEQGKILKNSPRTRTGFEYCSKRKDDEEGWRYKVECSAGQLVSWILIKPRRFNVRPEIEMKLYIF